MTPDEKTAALAAKYGASDYKISGVSGDAYAATKQEDDELDHMVQEASIPNLAALMKDAVKKGLITPTKGYASA